MRRRLSSNSTITIEVREPGDEGNIPANLADRYAYFAEMKKAIDAEMRDIRERVHTAHRGFVKGRKVTLTVTEVTNITYQGVVDWMREHSFYAELLKLTKEYTALRTKLRSLGGVGDYEDHTDSD